MSAAYGATIAKRRLSRRLRELREQTSFTARQVCDRLDWGRGKVGRIEGNTWRRPELSDIRDLLRFYHIDDDRRRELEKLAILARQRLWWREYGDVFGDCEFPGYEADAARIGCYAPLVLPGLLQTYEYAEAQMRNSVHPPSWRERALAARQRRQEILDRDDGTAPELVAVITEAALLYRWGTPEQRHTQVLHLLDAARRPNIEVRLLRFGDGLHPGMCGPIHLFDFPGTEPPAVFLETDFAVEQVYVDADVTAYIETFERICKAAMEPHATSAFLTRMATTMK